MADKKIVQAEEDEIFEPETAESADTYIHSFNKPFTFEGVTYNTLTFNWGKLTGHDAELIEMELQARGKIIISPEFSGTYLMCMAARACEEKLPSDGFAALPLADYNRIRSRARSFLLNSAS